jgi:hypothetical protein
VVPRRSTLALGVHLAKAHRFMLAALLGSALVASGISPTSAEVLASAPIPSESHVLAPVTVDLILLSGGKCKVDGHPLNCSDLSAYFRTINAEHRCRLRVHGRPNVPYADVAAALKAISDGGGCRIGYTNVSKLP